MASTAENFDSTTTQENPDYSERNWKPGLLYGRKEERWLADDASELYIEEVQDWMDRDAEYLAKYREGRFGPSDHLEYGEFDDLDDAVEYIEVIMNGDADLEELR